MTSDNLTEILNKLRSGLAELLGDQLEAVYLYGSQARGGSHRDSDIDVAIVSPDLSGDRLEDWCRLNRLVTQIDVRMEVIGFCPERFRDEDPLAWEIKNEGMRLL